MSTSTGRNTIDVRGVLQHLPHFDTFASIQALNSFVERLRGDSRFDISLAGTSAGGVPIYHIRFGKGSVKALFVAGPHAMEPIGSLTVFSLMSLLQQGNPALAGADVEWHIVPSIDPDGAILNEGWTQKPFTLDNYMRSFYVQPPAEQVDTTFPISYKKLTYDRPTREAAILKSILDHVRPDFYFSLHNAFAGGGTFYLVARDIGEKYHGQLHELLRQHRVPLCASAPQADFCAEFAAGIYETSSARKYYDYLEQKTSLAPEEQMKGLGANSIEYLLEIKPDALVLVMELPYLKHPYDGSNRETGQDLRQLKLRIDADNKFLTVAILEEWERVASGLDATNPFYRKTYEDVVALKDKLHEGGAPQWTGWQTRDLMFNPIHGGMASENDLLMAHLWRRLMPLCNGYGFVRLLKTADQTPAIRRSIERLERTFDSALSELMHQIDGGAFEPIDCNVLANVQFGSGLIALNAVLEARGHGP